ncbi:purine NTPase, partial [Reticulomyxa filosa]
LFEKQRYHAFDEIEGFVNIMDDLRKIKAVEQKTQRSYFQIIEKIFGFVRDVQKDVEIMLPSLFKQDPSFDYNRLFDCVVCVNQSKWIDERQEGGSSTLMNGLKNKIVSYLYELQKSSQHLELDIDHPDHLEQGRKIVNHFEKLRNLEPVIPEISNYRKEVAVQIEYAIRTTLSSIESVNHQKEIKEQLMKLKVYAESLNHANAYFRQKELKSAQDLEQIKKKRTTSRGGGGGGGGKSATTQDNSIEELKEQLEQYHETKKEFELLQQKEKTSFETASKFLKSHGFSENQIIELIDNQNELIEKIKQYEQEIDKVKTVGYNFGVLNATRTEKVLNYLRQCKLASFSSAEMVGQSEDKNQGTLRQELVTALHLVEHYLRSYDTSEIIEKVETVLNRLNEVMKLEKNHSVIFDFFPQDMMKQFIGKLEQLWLDLSDEMMNLARQANLPALKIKIFVTKALSALDDYTKLDGKFRSLFLKYQEILFNDVIDTTKVLKAIDDCLYTEVAAEMSKLNQRRDGDSQVEKVFDEVKGSLARSLKALAKSTMMKVLMLGENEANLESVIKLEGQLQSIEDAKNFVFEYVDEKTKQDIEKMEYETKASIEKWMLKVLATVKAAITSCNFWEAEDRIRLVRQFTRILGDHCEHIALNDTKEDNVKERTGKIANSVDELEKQLETVLKNVVAKYKNVNLGNCQFNPYTSDPPKALYDKLNKVMQTAATYNYKDRWGEIEEDITKKVREQLLEAREKVSALNSRESKSCIRLCESVLNYLPEHMQLILKDEIERCQEDVDYEIENGSKEVEQVMQKKDLKEINELLERCNVNQEKAIKFGINKMARDVVSRMESQWDDGQNLEAFSKIARYYTEAYNSLSNTFDKHHKNIINTFASVGRNISGLEWMKKSFTFILDCMEMKIAAKNDIDADMLLPRNFNEKIKELDHKISSYFNSLLQDYETSIKTMNDEELHTVLDIMKIIGNDENQFLQMVKMFMQKKVSCGIPNDSTTNIWIYSEMTRKLNAHLATMVDEIDREGVINDKTKANDVERERFFGLLKDKLEFFRRLSQLHEHINTKIFDNCSEKLEKHVQSLVTKIKDKSEWKNADCEKINLCYNCFTSMHKNGVLSNIVKNHVEMIEDIVNKRIEQLEKEASSNLNADKIMPVLIAMKLISVYIFSFKEIVNKRIDQLLSAYKREHTGINIPALALKLEKDPDGIGEMIVSEHNAFKGYNVALFNVKTQSHGIDYILKGMKAKGDKVDASKLEKKYEEFNSLYRKLVKENLTEDKQNVITLVNNTKLITCSIEQKPDD